MNQNSRRALSLVPPTQPGGQGGPELCTCHPLSMQQQMAEQIEDRLENDKLVLANQALNQSLCSLLEDFFPRSTPLSVLLLHISQREQAPIGTQTALLRRRRHYHAPASFLEQVLSNLRRVIRANDQLLLEQSSGAALVLPHVDEQGAYRILERVYHSISLLRAETVIPPLTRETTILLGVGSFPTTGPTVERLLGRTSLVAQSIVLRPAITPRLWSVKPASTQKIVQSSHEYLQTCKGQPCIPFMKLPKQIPARLKQLISYQIALELRCAPVGRDHQSLTVAMVHPNDANALQRLQQITGMSIFPVSCTEEDLNSLLSDSW